tara:strand:- start:66 stop:632 length:567 start_codon:yes stop_codon:yes gene_type:complete
MRIIAGDYKGRKIFEPLDKETRPLKNLTKESIFNILEHSKNVGISIKKSNVLDLFSGTGSFGLECISRRASKVYFIEQREPSIKILTKNIKKLNCEKKVNLFSENVFDLKKIKKIRENKFDLIFLDPPYKEKNINLLLNEINEMNILIEEGIIVLHKHKRSNDNFDNKFKILRTENYGISKVIFGKFI